MSYAELSAANFTMISRVHGTRFAQ